ncbi:hypothetical protein, partial [Acinetobacter baumannii]|uniref:hypothetical protein n=1 Tax=Acinetobacter baumannii TaxID=470 RepID=UPI002891E785
RKALAVKGVRQVVRLDDCVAVVADHTGAARRGLAALEIVWDDGPNAKVSSATLASALATASEGRAARVRQEGEPGQAGGKPISAVYE